jgi:hypothetical protein
MTTAAGSCHFDTIDSSSLYLPTINGCFSYERIDCSRPSRRRTYVHPQYPEHDHIYVVLFEFAVLRRNPEATRLRIITQYCYYVCRVVRDRRKNGRYARKSVSIEIDAGAPKDVFEEGGRRR